MEIITRRARPVLLSLTSVVIGFPMLAGAQGALEEIVVTAQRRETNMQQTPISITAFTSEDLELRGLEEARDLTIMIPNFAMGGGITEERDAQLFMRGVPGVGIYLDGVWQGNTGALFADFIDMERVEVLRGPQGTLFGRHTNGGAIQYVTKRPGREFGVSGNAEVGNYNRQQVSISIDAPVNDTLGTKWVVAKQDRDGYVESVRAPISFGGEDNLITRGDILWEPTDNLSVRFVYQDADLVTSSARVTKITSPNHRHITPYNVAIQNPAFLEENGGTLPGGTTYTPLDQNAGGGRLGRYENTMEFGDDGMTVDNRDANLTVEWHLGNDMLLRSITAVTETDSSAYVDFESTVFEQFIDDRYSADKEKSQELHLTGVNFDDRVDWLVGLYYRKSERRNRSYRWTSWEFFEPTGAIGDFGCRELPCPAVNQEIVDYVRAWGLANDPAACLDADPTTFPPDNNCMSTWSPQAIYGDSLSGGEDIDTALFGEMNFHITDKLTATVGLRFTQHDGRSFDIEPTDAFRRYDPHDPVNGDPLVGTIVDTAEDPDLPTVRTPKFALRYQFDDDRMLYLSYSEGFTAGEVNFVDLIGEVVLDPEVLKTRELGLRSDWLEGALRYNGTYFYSDWEGLRVNNLVPDPDHPGQILPFPYETSSGLARVTGWEHELIYAPNSLWRLNFTLALLDTEYLDVGDPEVSPLRIGDEFAYAPDVSYTIGVQRYLNLPSGAELTFRADYGWKDEYQKDSAPDRQSPEPEPAYGLLNARVVYGFPNRDWRLSLFGRNLTDEYYESGGIVANSVGAEFVTLGRPREYGLSFDFTF